MFLGAEAKRFLSTSQYLSKQAKAQLVNSTPPRKGSMPALLLQERVSATQVFKILFPSFPSHISNIILNLQSQKASGNLSSVFLVLQAVKKKLKRMILK